MKNRLLKEKVMMAGSSNELNTSHQIRSFSLPSKSNLINIRVQEELEKLRTKKKFSTSAAETISIGLSGLAILYFCINQVLSLSTQQALRMRKHEKCVSELLKVWSSLMNFAHTTKEIARATAEEAYCLSSISTFNTKWRINLNTLRKQNGQPNSI